MTLTKQDKKEYHRLRTLQYYRSTVQDIKRVVLSIHDKEDVHDWIFLLRAVLPIKTTNKAHHFNGGVVYINPEMFERLSDNMKVTLLMKFALRTASWMENRLKVKPIHKLRNYLRATNMRWKLP